MATGYVYQIPTLFPSYSSYVWSPFLAKLGHAYIHQQNRRIAIISRRVRLEAASKYATYKMSVCGYESIISGDPTSWQKGCGLRVTDFSTFHHDVGLKSNKIQEI
mgnify:CR=1 FL=1